MPIAIWALRASKWDLVAAVFRAQADALEIEALTKRRLVDEYDAAQERARLSGARAVETPPFQSGTLLLPPTSASPAKRSTKPARSARGEARSRRGPPFLQVSRLPSGNDKECDGDTKAVNARIPQCRLSDGMADRSLHFISLRADEGRGSSEATHR
jgi:hypothetical protein